jgi:16S rRNA (cytidine1402-2'-O)-methyltransferase
MTVAHDHLKHRATHGHPGRLYLVATPIGNLEDITLRALRILREVALVACEDTRTTRKLLNAYDIHARVVSYHEQGRGGKAASIVRQILEGKDVALVSEAGTPGLSDPGYELLRGCLAQGIQPVPIPGPSALLAALTASGMPVARFAFEGFLPKKRAERIRGLRDLRGDPRTLVFFESPRRLQESLADMRHVLGDRDAVVARELTKTFEEFVKGRLSDIEAWAQGSAVRGEITLVVAGREARDASLEALGTRIRFLRERCGLADRDVVRVVSEETGLPGKTVYRAVLEEGKETVERGDSGSGNSGAAEPSTSLT